MKGTTDDAVAQGRQTIQSAKAAGSGYMDQAKSMAGDAFNAAQVCIDYHLAVNAS
jgi:hypothetical protein